MPSCSISLCSRKTWGKGNFLVHWSQANWYLSFWWQLKTWAFKYFLACDEKSHKSHLNGLFTRSPWCATDMWFRSPCFNTILSHKGHFTFFFSWTVSMWIRNFVLFANDFMQDGHWCFPPDFAWALFWWYARSTKVEKPSSHLVHFSSLESSELESMKFVQKTKVWMKIA